MITLQCVIQLLYPVYAMKMSATIHRFVCCVNWLAAVNHICFSSEYAINLHLSLCTLFWLMNTDSQVEWLNCDVHGPLIDMVCSAQCDFSSNREVIFLQISWLRSRYIYLFC